MLGKILAKHHGFECTVLFAIDPETGIIDPDNQNNIPGLHILESADLMIIHTRFRDLPDDQMRHIAEYVESGWPIIGIRAAVAAFRIPDTSKMYARYGFRSRIKDWEGGFGQQILGSCWGTCWKGWTLTANRLRERRMTQPMPIAWTKTYSSRGS